MNLDLLMVILIRIEIDQNFNENGCIIEINLFSERNEIHICHYFFIDVEALYFSYQQENVWALQNFSLKFQLKISNFDYFNQNLIEF